MDDPLQTTLVSVRVSGGGDGCATVFARSHSFGIGWPLNFDEKSPRLSAVETLAGTFASDVVSGFQLLAARRRLAIDDVEARAEAAVSNPLAFLGVVGEQGPPHISRLTLRAYISTAEPEGAVAAVWDEALRRSPLVNTFNKAAELDLNFQIVL
jgi:hypothetical protein